MFCIHVSVQACKFSGVNVRVNGVYVTHVSCTDYLHSFVVVNIPRRINSEGILPLVLSPIFVVITHEVAYMTSALTYISAM